MNEEPKEININQCDEEGCKNILTDKVREYSQQNFNGKNYCFDCQTKHKKSLDTIKKPSENKDNFIVKISGKDFMTYEGLLNKAHAKGNFSIIITDSWVSEDMKKAWCKVRLTTKDQTFDGFGSSTPENTTSMTQSYPVEMAHTRAKGRAMRDFLNIGEVMAEELK